MLLRKCIIFLFALGFFASAAQVTNVRKWRKTERDSLEYGLFLYDDKAYLQALPIFEKIYNNHPAEEFIKYVYAKCGLYRSDKHEESYTFLSEIYQVNKRVEDIQYDLALAAHYNNKFDEAQEYITAYLLNRKLLPDVRANAELLKRYIANAKYYVSNATKARITGLGSSINTADEEYAPAIKADESAMIFTYVGPKSVGGRQNGSLQADRNGNYSEDIYMSYRIDGEFTPAFPLDSLNTNAPESAVSLNNDGSILYIFKNEGDNHGDLYQCELVGDHYSKPARLNGQVNSYSWDGHCSASPDGKTLFFSSERPGGYGGRDIYKASLSEDGSWQNAVNLGDSVNTPYDDDAPFIHPDGVSLFYSSKGKTSMGGYDVFKATMTISDSTFKKVENLGYPINSTDDDIYFVIAANGETAYYSSGKKGGKGMKDIYRVETNFIGPKPAVYLVKGDIAHEGEEVVASIKVEISSMNNALFRSFTSNPRTGYLVALPAGAAYKLTFSYKGYPDQVLEIDVPRITGYSEKIHNVDFYDKPVAVAPPAVAPTPTVAVVKGQAELEAKKAADAAARAIAEEEAKVKRLAAEKAAADAAAKKAAEEAAAKAEARRVAAETAAAEAAEKRAVTEAAAKAKAEEAAKAKRLAAEKAAEEKAIADAAAKKAAEAAAARAKAEADIRAHRLAAEKAAAEETAKRAREELAARTKAEAEAKAERIAAEKASKKAAAEVAAKAAAQRLAKEKAAREAAALAKARAEKLPVAATKTPAPKPAVATKTVAPVTAATNTFVSTMGRQKDGFLPRTRLHEKAIRYIDKYGDVKMPGLEFKVQITAFKTERNQAFPNLARYGKIERVTLGDGFIRLYIGGSFKTLRTAFALNKRVVLAGQTDAFVSAFYKGRRYSYEDLQRMGVFK